jgi:hypothetical protein
MQVEVGSANLDAIEAFVPMPDVSARGRFANRPMMEQAISDAAVVATMRCKLGNASN